MRRTLLRLLLPLAPLVVALTPVDAQAPLAPAGALTPRDSARVIRDARSEQARFERVRRNHLPWAWGGGSGECDERIGRFCLTHGRGGEDVDPWEPPPEDPEVVAARDRLLSRLAEAERTVPADGWVAGQRIRYLMEARRVDEARSAARGCGAAPWWCSALAGFVHHYAGEPAAADSAFDAALAAMSEPVRRDWMDLSHLLEPDALRAYRRLDDAGRRRFEERFWRLADPFFMRGGNELRSEHLARNVRDLFQDRAKSAENLAWGDDLREILLRYGWPIGWERIRGRPGALPGSEGMLTHYSGTDRDLLPPSAALLSLAIVEGSWDVEADAPRTGYSLPLADTAARWLETLDHQVAVFRRGDSARVVAAYELPADSFPGGAIEAALALHGGGEAAARVAPFPAGGTRGVLEVAAPAGLHLVSLEVLSEAERRAGRARFGLRVPPVAPGLLAVSDLLLLRSGDALPDSLPAALREARGSTRVQPGERIGVYWEVYGLEGERPQSATMSLRLIDRNGGWLRGLAERVGLASAEEPVRLRWQETADPAPLVARSLAVQIPELEPGEYALELAVTLPGREPLAVTRALQVP